MGDPFGSYPLSSGKQGTLFQRNPVCALCYDICIGIGNESGGINFNLLKSLRAADSLCAYLVENAWTPPEVEHCQRWLEEHLQNESAIVCASATVAISIMHMENAPEPLHKLGYQLRGLIYGGGNYIYDNLSSAAYQHTATIDPSAYGGFPNKPANMEELTPIIKPARRTTNAPKQPKRMNATQNNQYNGPVFNGPVFNGPVFNGPVYQAPVTQNYYPDSSSVSPESYSGSSSSAPGVRPEKDSRTKKLFLTPDGDEDFTRTEEERNRFLNYLSDHHLSQRQIDCSRDNPINKAVVCFYAKWKHLKYVRPQTGPAPLLRFLTDTCALQRAAEDRAISAILGKMLKSDYDPDIFYDVCDYFN